MVIHKIWIKTFRAPGVSEIRTMEGWFFLGFIPLYVRTLHLKH